MRGRILPVLVCVMVCGGSEGSRVVDLTWFHNDKTLFWPGNPSFNFTIMSRGQNGAFWYESNKFATAEHGGTHLDAPAHFYEGGWRVHDIPAERLVGPAVVIDVTSKASADPDYRVMISDIQDYETVNNRVPEGAAVLMKSGWGDKYPNKTLVFNSDTPDNPATFHFPGFHEDTVAWLITNRKIGMIGVDTPSTDYGQSTEFNVHVTAAQNNVLGLENVARLDQIPVRGATIIVGVIKLYDGSGGPARMLAMYDTVDSCGCIPSSGSRAEVFSQSIFSAVILFIGLKNIYLS